MVVTWRQLIPDASPALLDMLAVSDGPVQSPIRAEIFGPQRFAEHGRSLAQTHDAALSARRASPFFPRVNGNMRVLRQAHRYIGAQAATGYDISPAAEWLLDNFHLVEAQIREIREGLPLHYFRRLPVLQAEPLAGLPRIYGVAWAFVAHTDGAFDEDLLATFLGAYQDTRELGLRELWALPTTLRVVLLDNLRRLAERVATSKAAREAANLCCDRIETLDVPAMARLRDRFEARGVGPIFLAQVALRLRDRPAGAGETDWAGWLRAVLPDPAALQLRQQADQAADNLSMSNAVGSLRTIGEADWSELIGRTSALMRMMLTSPVFAAEHGTTRDRTLHGIERLARRSGRSETGVARTLLDLMAAAREGGAQDRPERAAPGHWLQGEGRPTLVRALGLDERLRELGRAGQRHLVLPLYLGVLLLGTLGLVAAMWRGRPDLADPSGPVALLALLLMLFPASEAVIAVWHRLISESVRPEHLPRLALADGIPAADRVLVVVPALLTDAASTRALVHRLHLHRLANPERQAQFALLTDWGDAAAEHAERDAGLLDDAVRGIRELNRAAVRHPGQGESPFLVLHRGRRFSPTEQCWMGWERKRGKLLQLVARLADPAAAPEVFADLGAESRIAAGTRHVVTLDSDTRLPPGCLRELVGVAAHPLNRPRLDATGRAVVRGYGILQPRIVTPLPDPQAVTHFHALFAGRCGIDPYSAASSEVYQDVFGEGTFTGKGLLDVATVHAVLAARLPEGRVLSHDLLEGALARCAAVSDLALIEDAPFHADVAAARIHRWIRGDWQLLPFLVGRRRGLRGVNRWKMIDNLRRSLVAPMSLAWLVVVLASGVLAPGPALALVMAAFTAGPLLGAGAGFVSGRRGLGLGLFCRQAVGDVVRAVGGGLWHVAQLLAQAGLALDAIARALYRLGISHRRLLEWTTSAAVQAAAPSGLAVLLRRHAPETAAALALLAILLWGGMAHPAWGVALCLLWSASPLTVWWASRPRPRLDARLSVDERQRLEGIARDTWRLFERCVGAEDRFLPPDNLQTEPHDMVAHRTSPTNIGLYLLSVACARQFGWIDTAELLRRLEATLATLATLTRHRGHFLNWYDTQTGAPLLPMYVSTVDSGNLGGHLLAVAQACRALAASGDDTPQAARLLRLAGDCERLAWEPDFTFLYHRRRHLLHIGYQVAEQQLDASCYDLLASESRLTSVLAIAKGDVPVSHWRSLGRPFCAIGRHAGLRSWSGSMFEYLMPGLVLDEPHGSVLREAGHAAIDEQIAFARAHVLPWGLSECAYAGQDHTLAYQYAPQGVPRLALRRTPPDEIVIAPYATALAAQWAPRRALDNFAALEALGARGDCGFIEALDFSPARQVAGQACTPVRTFMAHHQGMTIAALANVLLDGVVRRWGMADPHIEAVASLLHERAPRDVPALDAMPAVSTPQALLRPPPGLLREVVPGQSAVEPTHLLSNGRYSVTLRSSGAGRSRWGRVDLTRWRDDGLRDAFGSFFHLRWGARTDPVSLTRHPAPDPAAHYRCLFHADRVGFVAEWAEVRAQVTVWVSPEDDIEFRRVELCNPRDEALDIELTSAFEVTLSAPGADEAHPAFANLFVQARWRAGPQALVFVRRPRLVSETGLQMAHFVAESDPQVTGLSVQTDRQRWRGRNRAASRLQADLMPAPDVDTALDTGFDPVCVLAVHLRLAPHAKAQVTLATAASEDDQVLQAVIDKYRQPSHVQRASLMSATLTGIRLRALRISVENLAAVQSLTTALLLTLSRRPVRTTAGAMPSPFDRRCLWRLSLSGERPIVLVTVAVPHDLGLLRALAQAMRLWSWGGLACDLVVVNEESASYQMTLQRELRLMQERHGADSAAELRLAGSADTTRMHALLAAELSGDERDTLHQLACIVLRADGRPLQHHVQAWCAAHDQDLVRRQGVSVTPLVAPPCAGAPATVPTGSFDADGGAFRFEVGLSRRPARPWINVLANPTFGTQVSEAGGGCTWALNSRLNQLTAWSNDPVDDPPSEWLLLQDVETRRIWSLTPCAWGAGEAGGDGRYHVTHGQGVSTVAHRHDGIDVEVSWCVDAEAAVKQVRVRLAHGGTGVRRLRLVGLVEWMMGAARADRGSVATALYRQRRHGQVVTALLATQREQAGGFGGGTAFLSLVEPIDHVTGSEADWTCDRREAFDSRGGMVLPDHWGRAQGSGLDPCAALSTRVTLPPGGAVERVFLLGYAGDAEAARALALRAGEVAPQGRLDESRDRWDRLLGATVVTTPDPLFDVLVNRWLLYQTVSCRLWAKAGFYQAGGATGFRDQLQDAMALVWADPGLLRAQILRCAARQFSEGDVQHWWHDPTGAGVRTRFSDDLLWLVQAVVHHLRCTGDVTLLDEQVPFIEGAAIPAGAEDVYEVPRVGTVTASVYEHAARTLDRSLRVGAHGLPLMGGGDWNDGMNRVGIGGRGESVWLGWFLCALVADFAPLARRRGDVARARCWESVAQRWTRALQGVAWDGGWFRRAFFDDGQVLGSHAGTEARIDLIAQAWAVLSGVAALPAQRLAMAAARALLADPGAGLMRLLDPPLAHAEPSAGYIQAYPPGVRENGGQYAHAAVWALMAQARLHRSAAEADLVYRDFTWLSPAHRAADPSWGSVYGLEPYVMAGDICSQPPHAGRGGWSWYTGAAAWMHRAAIESIFGLRLTHRTLSFSPCLPSHWPQAELTLRRGERVMHVVLRRAGAARGAAGPVGADVMLVPGQPLEWRALAPHTRVVVLVPPAGA